VDLAVAKSFFVFVFIFGSDRFSCSQLKLENFLDALEDAKKALELDKSSSLAILRKGEALFELGEFEGALKAFEEGEKLDAQKFAIWIRKAKAELATDGEAAEEKKEEKQEEKKLVEEKKAAPPVKIRHEWYQTDSGVVVTIFCKNLKAEQITTNITNTQFDLSIKLDNSSTYEQSWELFGEIRAEETKQTIYGTKVEFVLAKTLGIRWGSLEKTEEAKPAEIMNKPTTFTEKKKVNWDKYLAEQDLNDDDPLNKVFKDIYGNGSEEQRRAMQKSYVESGGTVLSTNWEDVGKKKVEVSPPDGMIAKKWSSDEVVAEGGTKKEKK
jgi:suppressor of G2 allele of SKP1